MTIRHFLLTVSCLILRYSCQHEAPTSYNLANESSYVKARMAFKSQLNQKIVAPQAFEELEDYDDVKVVHYNSNDMKMQALLVESNIEKGNKNPVVVYLHGGFALDNDDIIACQSFTDAGFIVFAPSFRGENGNPGHHELFMGEVDDAIVAIDWISKKE